jgi:hypothetical protein
MKTKADYVLTPINVNCYIKWLRALCVHGASDGFQLPVTILICSLHPSNPRSSPVPPSPTLAVARYLDVSVLYINCLCSQHSKQKIVNPFPALYSLTCPPIVSTNQFPLPIMFKYRHFFVKMSYFGIIVDYEAVQKKISTHLLCPSTVLVRDPAEVLRKAAYELGV